MKRLQVQAKQARSQQPEERQPKQIERLSIELDGVLARMRRGSVPMEKEERQRKGDVYREIKAGAVFRAERGSKRSELAPGVYVDTPQPDSLRYVARRTAKGGFDWLLYQLAEQWGLSQAQQVVVIGDGAPWIWNLAAEHFPGAVQIVDLYHAKEHVWHVAHAVFGSGTAAGTAWATHACSLTTVALRKEADSREESLDRPDRVPFSAGCDTLELGKTPWSLSHQQGETHETFSVYHPGATGFLPPAGLRLAPGLTRPAPVHRLLLRPS